MKGKLLRRTLSMLLMAVMTAALFAGCGSSSTSSGASATKDVTYVSMADAVGLSPMLTNDSASATVIRGIYETLFMRDPKTGEIKPLLAEGFENPDPNTWIIKLKKNIKFQDGTPFNSEAVKYDFEKMLDPKTASPRASLLKSIDKIETPDEYTVKLHTKTPYGIMLTALSHDATSIVSPTADKAGDINKNPKGAGTGPFVFKEWVSGDHITVTKNKDYWGGAPKLDSVTFKVVPEMTTAVSMLESGEADMLVGIPPEHLDRLKSNKDVQVTQLDGNPITYVGFNFEKKPLDNLKVRQAIEYAINRDEYIGTLNGLAVKSNGIIGPRLLGYDKEIESHGYNYDVEKAKLLLAEAGASNLKISLTYGSTDTYNKIAPFIQAQLKKAGIEVTLNPMDWAAYLSYTKSGKAEMYLGGWSNVTGDGEELLYPQFFSGNIDASNYNRYNDPAGDALILKTRETVDQKERVGYLREANIKFTDDVQWVPLYHGAVTMATRKNLTGVEFESNNEFRLNNADKE